MQKVRITTGVGENAQGGAIAGEQAAKAIEKIAVHMSKDFGGVTMTSGKGGWVNDEGKLVVEDVVIFESIGFGLTNEELSTKAHAVAEMTRDLLQQQVVVMEVLDAGHAHLV